MNFYIEHQDEYSRGQLLLRSFFGFIYIAIPHGIGFIIFGIGAAVLQLLTFFVTLFTGKYPRNWFDYQLNLMKWQLRVNARLMNLVDGNPQWGMKGTDDKTSLEVAHPEKVNQGLVLLRALLGFVYVLIPHGICMIFMQIGMMFVNLIAWFAVLITGKYPAGMHNYCVKVLRWNQRVSLYMYYMTDKYPKFSGEVQPHETALPPSQVSSSTQNTSEDILDQ